MITNRDVSRQEETNTCVVPQNKSTTKPTKEEWINMPTSMITTGSQGMIQAFGITTQKKLFPAERIILVNSMSMDERCENIAYGQTFEASEKEVFHSDTGEELHLVFSSVMQESHRNSLSA